MKALLNILLTNGSGVFEGNFSSDLTFEEIVGFIAEERDMSILFKFSFGKENLGLLQTKLSELAGAGILSQMNIDRDKLLFGFGNPLVVEPDCYIYLKFFKYDSGFGSFIATIH